MEDVEMYYLNKIKNKLSNLFSKLKNSIVKEIPNIFKFLLIISLVALFLFSSVWLFKYCNIQNPTDVQSQEIYIYEISLGNWCTWITLIGLLFTALWSMHQYNKNRLSKQQEKASEIAQDFANNLIERMGLISYVLTPIPIIKEIMKNLDTSRLNEFTAMEILEILNDEKYIDSFFETIESDDTQKKYNDILKQKYNDKEIEKFDSTFALLIENTLNKLEAICINISSKAAGSQFIYESLHQMFLSTVEILSIKISIANTDNIDKYYLNIISVYNMWNIQKENDIKKLKKTRKKVQRLEKKRDKEIKKLLSKQTKTV